MVADSVREDLAINPSSRRNNRRSGSERAVKAPESDRIVTTSRTARLAGCFSWGPIETNVHVPIEEMPMHETMWIEPSDGQTTSSLRLEMSSSMAGVLRPASILKLDLDGILRERLSRSSSVAVFDLTARRPREVARAATGMAVGVCARSGLEVTSVRGR